MSDTPDSGDQKPGDQKPGDRPSGAMPPMPPMPPAAPGHGGPADQPGVVPLRPLGVGDMLNGAIATMRTRPGLMMGLAAIVVTVTQLIVLAATYPLLDDVNRAALVDANTSSDEAWDLVVTSLGVGIGAALFGIIARVFLTGFLTQVVGDAVTGRRAGFGDVWTRVRPRLLPLLGMTLLIAAVAAGFVLVVVLMAVLAPALGVLVGLAGIVVGVWLIVLFSLGTPALVLENLGVIPAFGRSRQLVGGAWWRIFGITLLAVLIAVVVAFLISLPFEIAGGGYDVNQITPTGSYLFLSTIGVILASTITEPFVAAVTVLLYVDQRFRREGMHLEMMRSTGI